jgi:hypothetical protein
MYMLLRKGVPFPREYGRSAARMQSRMMSFSLGMRRDIMDAAVDGVFGRSMELHKKNTVPHYHGRCRGRSPAMAPIILHCLRR